MRKPTLHDVARTAGVSYATADRVLNERGGVAQKSILRVRQAIEDLGYERDQHAANLSRRRSYRFRFLAPQGDHGFFRVLRAAVEAERAGRLADRVSVEIRDIPALDAEALAAALDALGPEDCDSVALVAIDTPRVVEAIARLRGRGVPAVTLVADAGAARAAHVGIDNVVAGRAAGRMIEIAHTGRPGRVLPVLGALTQRDHRDRLQGAVSVLEETGGRVEILPALVAGDRSDLMAEVMGAALAVPGAVTGVYSIGAGNRGLLPILRGMGQARPFVVLHELTDFTRAALLDRLVDAVIDQTPDREVALTLDVMKALADGRPLAGLDLTVTPKIYLQDNLPPAAEG